MTLLEIKERELQKGIKLGIEQGKSKIAKNLLDVLDDDITALKTGLDLEEVHRLREEK